MIVSNIVVL